MQQLNIMRSFVCGLIVLLVGTSAGASQYIVAFKNKKEFREVQQNFYAAPIHGFQNQVTEGMILFDPAVRMINSLDHIQMVIVESDDEQAMEMIKNDPRVLAVDKDTLIPGPKPINTIMHNPGEKEVISTPVKRPWGLDAIKVEGAWKVTRGAGVKVLIVDTGLDRDHSEFTGRVLKGKNFLGRRASDPAPYDFFDDIGHGTHVAGTVLGSNVGVAPEAELLAGRVCGNFGCGTAAITQAIDWGVAEGADVMNLSLGGPCRGRTVNIAYKNAKKAGVVIVAATGNSAQKKAADGSITFVEGVSCPGAFTETIGAGAMGEDRKRAGFSQFGKGLDLVAPGVGILSAVPKGSGRASDSSIDKGEGPETLESTSFQGSKSGVSVTGSMLFAGIGKPEDFKGKDFKGKIALIQRGELRFAKKTENAIDAGARGVIIFNNEKGSLNGAITQGGKELDVPVIGLTQKLGEELKALLDKGDVLKAEVKVDRTDYSALQGTSMASPHIAGVSALVRAAKPGLNVDQVRDLLVKTAVDLNDAKGTGAGLVDAEDAVYEAKMTEPMPVAPEPEEPVEPVVPDKPEPTPTPTITPPVA